MQAMDRVYREYSVPLYRYLLTLTRDAALAEELTQETFCEAVRCIERYDGSCQMLTWLCQIGKRNWYDHLKKQARRQTVPIEQADRHPAAPGDSPELAAETADGLTRIYQKIHALPPENRELVLLRSLGGLSFRQIGAILGISENAARVKFYRAKTQLAKTLEQEGVEL